jgi:hypothetical protein
MRQKIIKVEIIVESNDLEDTEELCANFIVSKINKIIEKTYKKYNTSFWKVRRVSINSKFDKV